MPSVREPIPEEEEQDDQPLFISHSKSHTHLNGTEPITSLGPSLDHLFPVRSQANGRSPVRAEGTREKKEPSLGPKVSPTASRTPNPYPTPSSTATYQSPDNQSNHTSIIQHTQSHHNGERPRSQHIHFPSESPVTSLSRPRKLSQHADPYGTFSRRSSAIFGANVGVGGLAQSPTPSGVGIFPGSNASSLAQFPVLDENEDTTPSVAVPVRSRLPSIVDGGQFRHLRTLSTVSIHEKAERPGGLAVFGAIGKLVGAQKTEGADGPPSTLPEELRA